MTHTDTRTTNLEYYQSTQAGREDYWLKMAAPRHRVRTLLDLIGRLAPGALVDLGCGGGQLLAEVHAKYSAVQLTGLDLSDTQIEANKVRLPGIRWETLDLESESAIPGHLVGKFDVLTASELIEHLAKPAQFLGAIRALARPAAGRLLLTTQSGRIHETERRVGHVRHFTSQDLASMLADAGWSVERVWNTGFPFHDLSKWWANRNPDATMARFSSRPYGPLENAVCAALRVAFLMNSGRRGAQLFAVAHRAA